jgi:hypothetical protein
MREARAAAIEEGVAIAFPFKATDVQAIHGCFHKYGRGIYFRLNDGRVFSAFGTDLDPNPARYDTPPAILPFPPQGRARPARSS